MVSVIIPCLNEDNNSLYRTIEAISDGYSGFDMEIIVINDGSVNSDGTPKIYSCDDFAYDNTIAINRPKRFGVGAAFDLGVKYASGDTIVLCGADIYPERGKWLTDVLNAVKEDEIGSACSVGLNPLCYDINEEGLYQRYGAKILYTMTEADLPKTSPILQSMKRHGETEYRDILEAKWLSKQSDDPYEIPCVYGAFYWMKRDQYLRMGGFDGQHKYWGGLEAWLSLKARCYGIKPTMYPHIKVGHVFGRLGEGSRADRLDYKYWNKLFVAHTLLDDKLRDKVIAHMPHSLNWSLAQVMVKQNWSMIQETRQKNRKNGKLISE